MKLMYCEKCGDIIAPHIQNRLPRWCYCGQHAVWWEDGEKGIIRVHAVHGPTVDGPAEHNKDVWLLGIANCLLMAEPGWERDPVFFMTAIKEMPDTALFKQVGSLIVKFRPGDTGDSAWSPLLDTVTN